MVSSNAGILPPRGNLLRAIAKTKTSDGSYLPDGSGIHYCDEPPSFSLPRPIYESIAIERSLRGDNIMINQPRACDTAASVQYYLGLLGADFRGTQIASKASFGGDQINSSLLFAVV
jgi:hypothetical protein